MVGAQRRVGSRLGVGTRRAGPSVQAVLALVLMIDCAPSMTLSVASTLRDAAGSA